MYTVYATKESPDHPVVIGYIDNISMESCISVLSKDVTHQQAILEATIQVLQKCLQANKRSVVIYTTNTYLKGIIDGSHMPACNFKEVALLCTLQKRINVSVQELRKECTLYASLAQECKTNGCNYARLTLGAKKNGETVVAGYYFSNGEIIKEIFNNTTYPCAILRCLAIALKQAIQMKWKKVIVRTTSQYIRDVINHCSAKENKKEVAEVRKIQETINVEIFTIQTTDPEYKRLMSSL